MVLNIISPKELRYLDSAVRIVEDFSIFFVFGVLEEAARDIGSKREGKIELLKYISLAVHIVPDLMGMLYDKISPDTLAMAVSGLWTVGIAAAIVSVFVLFGLRREVLKG